MVVGQHVWHVGKNITTEEVVIKWISPSTDPESPVLVEKLQAPIYSQYALMPKRTLSESKPFLNCPASWLPHLMGTFLLCDRYRDHEADSHPIIALHHYHADDREIYWSTAGRRTNDSQT
jgi:hypothetical protein